VEIVKPEKLERLRALAARHRDRANTYRQSLPKEVVAERVDVIMTPVGRAVARDANGELCPTCGEFPAHNVVTLAGHEFPTPCVPCWRERRRKQAVYMADSPGHTMRPWLTRQCFNEGWKRLEARWHHYLNKPNRLQLKEEYYHNLRKRLTDSEFEEIVGRVIFSEERFPRPAAFIEIRERLMREKRAKGST
jgi:hypothetical protein